MPPTRPCFGHNRPCIDTGSVWAGGRRIRLHGEELEWQWAMLINPVGDILYHSYHLWFFVDCKSGSERHNKGCRPRRCTTTSVVHLTASRLTSTACLITTTWSFRISKVVTNTRFTVDDWWKEGYCRRPSWWQADDEGNNDRGCWCSPGDSWGSLFLCWNIQD